MSRAGIFSITAVATGSIMWVLALVGALTWAPVGSAFGFYFSSGTTLKTELPEFDLAGPVLPRHCIPSDDIL